MIRVLIVDDSALVRKILSDGSRAGLWKLEDTRVTTLALLAMLTGVNTWYQPMPDTSNPLAAA